MTQKSSATIACAFIILMVAATTRITAQAQPSTRPDLSGRWQLNHALSDDAKQKLASMGSSQGVSGHGPSRHGGFGALFGGGRADHRELEEVLVNAPTNFVVTQDDQKVVLTAANGNVRTLPTNNRKVKVTGRDVQTRWENNRLVSEITVGRAKVVTYERSAQPSQLIVTAKVNMRGHDVTVRRVYDAVAD